MPKAQGRFRSLASGQFAVRIRMLRDWAIDRGIAHLSGKRKFSLRISRPESDAERKCFPTKLILFAAENPFRQELTHFSFCEKYDGYQARD